MGKKCCTLLISVIHKPFYINTIRITLPLNSQLLTELQMKVRDKESKTVVASLVWTELKANLKSLEPLEI